MTFGGGVQWNGETTSIAAWGSEAGMNNGFAAGEEFTFGIIDSDSEKPFILQKLHILLAQHIWL